jgi:hypothetical protein
VINAAKEESMSSIASQYGLALGLAVATLGAGCEERVGRDDEVAEARRELEEAKRDAVQKVAKAEADASARVAEAQRELALARREKSQSFDDKDYTFSDRREFADKRRGVLVDLDRELDQAERAAENAAGEARAEIRQTVQRLKEERKEIGRELERVDDVTEREWEQFKGSVDRTMTDLREGIRDVRLELCEPGSSS